MSCYPSRISASHPCLQSARVCYSAQVICHRATKARHRCQCSAQTRVSVPNLRWQTRDQPLSKRPLYSKFRSVRERQIWGHRPSRWSMSSSRKRIHTSAAAATPKTLRTLTIWCDSSRRRASTTCWDRRSPRILMQSSRTALLTDMNGNRRSFSKL